MMVATTCFWVFKIRPSNSAGNTDGHNILRGSCPGKDSFFRFYKMSVDMRQLH